MYPDGTRQGNQPHNYLLLNNIIDSPGGSIPMHFRHLTFCTHWIYAIPARYLGANDLEKSAKCSCFVALMSISRVYAAQNAIQSNQSSV